MLNKIFRHLRNKSLISTILFRASRLTKSFYFDFPKYKNILFTNKTFIGKKIKDNKSSIESYCMIYQENRSSYTSNQFDIPKLEILKGVKSKFYKTTIDKPSLIPIGLLHENTILDVESSNQKLSLNYLGRLDYKNKFLYLSFNEPSDLKITSNKNLIFGHKLEKLQILKTKKKLVLQIFIDGLSQLVFDNTNLDELMPNTNKFFDGGINHNNCFSNGEWTLPSSASIMTGCYTGKHGLFHTTKDHQINSKKKLMSEYFQENGYITFLVTPNWRQSPLYGYTRGFDRIIYRRDGLKVNDVIYQFKEQINAFPDRSTYAFLSIFDLHDVYYKKLPEISLQVKSNLDSYSNKNAKNKESVFSNYDLNLVEEYKNKIKYIDRYLEDLYTFINNHYDNNEVIINLVSDHGQSFLGGSGHILSPERTHVKFMLKDSSLNTSNCRNIMQNVDVLPTILDLAGIDYKRDEIDGKNIFDTNSDNRYLAFSQSVFPGQTYKACIRDSENEFYFESEKNLGENLVIDFKKAKYSKFNRMEGQEISMRNDEIEFIQEFIIKEINKSEYLTYIFQG